MSKLNKLTVLSFFFLSGALTAAQTPNECCEPSPHPERVTLRHIEGKGIGYNQGYTTLEGFFTAPGLMDTVWFPFVDLRGHLFNDGKSAANVGVGLRYLTASHVWGINSYFDYRNTHRHHYNQYGLGLECLGRVFDFRINGYFPFGKQQSSYYKTGFSHFTGHNMILSRRREISFKGVNAEVGAHTKLAKNFSLYSAAGPYFIGHGSRNAWGGEIRLALDITEYFRIEGNASYDRIFKGIGQGQISLNLPFGPRKTLHRRQPDRCSSPNSCSKELMLRRRALQRVDRDEIIVVEKRRFQTTALDPVTGQPLFFVFVNNTSHSDGTFESPYPTLTLAQTNSGPGDIIMVFPGNGSPYLNQPITLKDSQKLFGTGISHTIQTSLGSITIPALSSSFPIISTTVATPAVTLGNINEISGMQFSPCTGDCIRGGNASTLGITTTSIHHNIFSQGLTGVDLFNCSGNLQIANNQMTNMTFGVIISHQTVPVTSNLAITNNTISNSSTFGIEVASSSPSGHVNLFLANNTVNNANDGIVVTWNATAGQSLCGILENNSSINCSGDGYILTTNTNAGAFNLALVGNASSGNAGAGFNFFNSLGNNCYLISNNTSVNNGFFGYEFSSILGPINVEDFANFSSHNTGTTTTVGLINSVPAGTCNCH